MELLFTISSWASTVILLFWTVNTGQATTVFYKVGDEVVLSPGSVAAPITSITWKLNSNLAVEWYGGTIVFFSSFRGHCELNTTTGELIIPELTLEDSGYYTPVVNGKVLNPTEIKFISGVPKPTVSENCDAEKTHCVLTCEGITTDCEPVTYTWSSGDVTKSETKELKITKEETEPSFICELKNPVSSERSEEVLNPFISENNYLKWLIPVLVLVLAAVAGVFICKRITGRFPSCFKKNDVADTKVHPGSGSEEKKLISGTNGEVQLDYISEPEPLNPPPKPPRCDSVSGPSHQPEGEIKSDKDESPETRNESAENVLRALAALRTTDAEQPSPCVTQ